jgi:3-dehydroquinate synthase
MVKLHDRNRAPAGTPGHPGIHWQRFSVPFEYPVAFTSDVFDEANRMFVELVSHREPAKRHRCLFVLDDGVLVARPQLSEQIAAYVEAHADRLALIASPLVVAGGEGAKLDHNTVREIAGLLLSHRVDRHSFLCALGGGAMLDAAGLAAAVVHRGVRHVRLPTTVLSQSDSGVGVKNGINFSGIKNFIGCFAPPFAVINDLTFVDLLPSREKVAGMAEAVKVALIRDRDFFVWLERNAHHLKQLHRTAVASLIQRCAYLHMRQIAMGGDPFETGCARPLDFGHWSAHKLESLSGHALRHGEAVAIGIALDTRYSVLAGRLREGEDERVCRLLRSLGLNLWHPALDERSAPSGRPVVLDGLADFREHLGGELTITLLREVGVGIEVHEIDDALMNEAIAWLRERRAG